MGFELEHKPSTSARVPQSLRQTVLDTFKSGLRDINARRSSEAKGSCGLCLQYVPALLAYRVVSVILDSAGYRIAEVRVSITCFRSPHLPRFHCSTPRLAIEVHPWTKLRTNFAGLCLYIYFLHSPHFQNSAQCPTCWISAAARRSGFNKLPLLAQTPDTSATTPTTSAMDLNSLKDQVSNLTLYDLKAGFRKAQNGRCGVRLASWPLLMRCSGHELHRDGGQGARGNQQRAVG
jgi:hypothetical protein